ncbi:MAG: bacterial transcriptional activator domain-containing protein [Syntrophobacteraceae bacterium]
MMEIFLFGGVRVNHSNLPAGTKMTRSVQRLLAYLLLYRDRPHPRSVLSGVFWGDQSEKSARGSLKTALWRLHEALDHPGVPRKSYLVTTRAGEVGFNTRSNHWLDTAVFEQGVGRVTAKKVQAMDAGDAVQLENALNLRSGELLEGFYDDWALPERERLNTLHFRGMEHMMRYKWHLRAFGEAVAWGLLILSHDPLREGVHRELMRLYVESGQRGLALKQYRTCCRIMDEELGIGPSEETQRLHSEFIKRPGPICYDHPPRTIFPIHSAGETGRPDAAPDDPYASLLELEQFAGRLLVSVQTRKNRLKNHPKR